MVPITTLYAALLVLLVIGLGTRVALLRMFKAPAEQIRQPERVHANLIENAPSFLICLLLAELAGGAGSVLHGLGAAFVAARLSHAYGLSRWAGASWPRRLGIISTWTLMGATASYALWLSWAPRA